MQGYLPTFVALIKFGFIQAMQKSIFPIILSLLLFSHILFASGKEGNDGLTAVQGKEQVAHETAPGHKGGHEKKAFDPKNVAFHHISNQNIYSIGDWAFPLPCFLYAPGSGWTVFMSSKFGIGHHGTGHYSWDRYVLKEGSVFRVTDAEFPMGKQTLDDIKYETEVIDGKEREVAYAHFQGEKFKLDPRTTFDGGLIGGGVTSFYDFSISKNVVFMFIVVILLLWMFISIAKAYKRREGQAPKGIQSLFEVIILFIRDEVAKPFIGAHYRRYFPYLLTIFFFILALNLLGQIPFFGASNVTGNLTITLMLAVISALVVNLTANRNYWMHVLWMPGVPWWLKALILTPVEVLGLVIKPFTLMLRLFANITAGHIVIVIFVGLIFIFGDSGESVPGSIMGIAISIPMSLFMSALELLVAFIQAFVFTLLTASYIGAAVEEHHH